MNNKPRIITTIERHNTTWDVVCIREGLWGIKKQGERVTFSSKNREVVYLAIDDLYSKLDNYVPNTQITTSNNVDVSQESGSKILAMLGSKDRTVMKSNLNKKFDTSNKSRVTNSPNTQSSENKRMLELERRVSDLEKEILDLKDIVIRLNYQQ